MENDKYTNLTKQQLFQRLYEDTFDLLRPYLKDPDFSWPVVKTMLKMDYEEVHKRTKEGRLK